MNKIQQALFELRSSGGKACKQQHGNEHYAKIALLSHKKRRLNKKLSTAKSNSVLTQSK